MSYSLYRDLISLTEEFEETHGNHSLKAFSSWLAIRVSDENDTIDWEGKSNGRSAESVINTALVRLYRYAKLYSKIAIAGSSFTTIDDVIFLMNLTHFGAMSKKRLIDMNIHEKSTGTQIINRLLLSGYIEEKPGAKDRRVKLINVTGKGKIALDENMGKIREASKKVVGNLTSGEQQQLIRLLLKLEMHHQSMFKEGFSL